MQKVRIGKWLSFSNDLNLRLLIFLPNNRYLFPSVELAQAHPLHFTAIVGIFVSEYRRVQQKKVIVTELSFILNVFVVSGLTATQQFGVLLLFFSVKL